MADREDHDVPTDWDIDRALRCCERLEREHFSSSRFIRYPAFTEALSKVLAFCDEEMVCPEHYLCAQYEALSGWIKKQGKALYPNMLLGRNARERYRRWACRRRERYNDSRYMDSRMYRKEVEAFIDFAENLFGAFFSCESFLLEAEIRRASDDFDVNTPSYERTRTVADVLDRFYPGLSEHVLVQNHAWGWEDIISLLSVLFDPAANVDTVDLPKELGVFI